MSDLGRLGTAVETGERYGGVGRSYTSGFTWGRVVLAILLVTALAFGAYRLVWPASYYGAVRWAPDYSSITLVDKGVTLDVSDSTGIFAVDGGPLSLEFLRALPQSPTGSFVAQVIYRPYLSSKGRGNSDGFAQTIARR